MQSVATCAQCGKTHQRSEMELSFKRPDAVVALSESERRANVKESDDLCTINAERFFVRAILPLNVREWNEPYRIGVWVEVDDKTFERVRELWTDPDQYQEPAFRAEIANDIPSFVSTCGMQVRLQLTGPTTRPDVLIPESDHPLHREQCLGISAHRASEYSTYF